MLSEKFYDVLKHEGSVSITSWSGGEPHVVGTWNSYLVITEDGRILAPAAGMWSLEEDLKSNNKVILLLAAREVEGFNGYQGTGFRLEGTAKLVEEGSEFTMMKEKFSFLRKVLEITPITSKQLL
ncbi:MAG: pyridoxamine 5'-phosphate oxidase family protein [Alphaproteobacteria bacterium]|jgi:hypothetical protein|nr:pyridoxamine 5'-phosphate oxidase family protein [Alphaproteobacteria bacterium]